ncbi:CAP domain-containing protein [Lysinibacillus piscis]|uniref:Membrane protein n=1 Tax=Lysinibacillus piscis TaxID=2518931 RepID=A0ABQ5NGT8_9BACI|nr:CAP domain-containing protein [Lysinibacillus sp. KH24]GLC87579.1 membrane protein [Lysinibacillus sp. KH24]
MKALFRILMVGALIVIVGVMFFNTTKENEPLEGPDMNTKVIPKTELKQPEEGAMTRPQQGLSMLIGQNTERILEQYGEPTRKEPSTFGYDWWVYNTNNTHFFMLGVQNQIVTQVYIAGEQLDASPFKIGQKRDDIYRMVLIESEVAVNVDDNIFIFSMSEKDMQTRLLVKFDGLFAQLYIDSETGDLQGVRFTDNKTLILHQPYEMTYQGELVTSAPPSSFLQQEIDQANIAQMDDLTNVLRNRHQFPLLTTSEALEKVATMHSEDMKTQGFLGHESPTYGDLQHRLETQQVEYTEGNENLATAYFDAIEVVHGWLNSTEHRKIMLNERYTEVGSGAFLNYYTQIFIEPIVVEPTPIEQQNQDNVFE